jgi:3-isopropylmalate/(R)-2-methylmalate dehydratase small subunit
MALINLIYTSTAVPLSIENVDTDQIIARFLKATERVGLATFFATGDTIMTILKIRFRFKQSTYKGKFLLEEGTLVLVLQENMQLGLFMITALDVCSVSFCRYLRNNCLNVGVLPVQVSAEFADKIFKAIATNPETEVNLPDQTIT